MNTATPSRMTNALAKSTANRSPLTSSTVNGRNGHALAQRLEGVIKVLGCPEPNHTIPTLRRALPAQGLVLQMQRLRHRLVRHPPADEVDAFAQSCVFRRRLFVALVRDLQRVRQRRVAERDRARA